MPSEAPRGDPRTRTRRSRTAGYLTALAGAVAVAALGKFSARFLGIDGAILVYLLAVVIVATRCGLGPSLVSALLGVVAIDYVVMPPEFAFTIGAPTQAATLASMILVAVMVSGLTERLRRHEERERALAVEAEKAKHEMEKERVRTALLSSVSHDLRTPLAMISSSAQMLSREHRQMAPDLREEVILAISQQADRLEGLVANLLAMTRVEAGALKPRTLPSSLPELMGTALGRSKHLLGNRPIETAFAPGLPLLDLDARLIEQVFINLLENAARYSPDGAPIRLSVESTFDRVLARVEDRGVGVPEHERELIFQKFKRGTNAARNDGGAGLGLTICRAIVEAHAGKITLAERPGGGSVVTIAFPSDRLTTTARRDELPSFE